MIIETIKIGPYRYTVDEEVLDGNLGETLLPQLRILIHPDQHPMSKVDTLLHEALHAVFAQIQPEGDEELLVQRLSPRLLDLLRDNPTLVRALTA